MGDVWVAGVGMTRFGRRDEGLAEMMAEAATAALSDAGVERPDALVVAAMNPEEFTGDGNYASLFATHLGLARVPALRVETATSSGLAALYSGFAAVAGGLHRHVLVVGGEKMTHVPTPRVSEIIGRSIDPHERRYGTTMPALAGLITRALMHQHGLTLREISQVAVKNHAHAARMAGFGPERVEVAEIHDAFAPFEIVSLEDTGLFPPGKAGRATMDGETAIDGRLPVNVSGGLKARGHPLAATGVGQVVELAWQLRGFARGREVETRVGLAQSIGGPAANNWVALLEARR